MPELEVLVNAAPNDLNMNETKMAINCIIMKCKKEALITIYGECFSFLSFSDKRLWNLSLPKVRDMAYPPSENPSKLGKTDIDISHHECLYQIPYSNMDIKIEKCRYGEVANNFAPPYAEK